MLIRYKLKGLLIVVVVSLFATFTDEYHIEHRIAMLEHMYNTIHSVYDQEHELYIYIYVRSLITGLQLEGNDCI